MATPEQIAALTAYVTSGASSVGGTEAAFIESSMDAAISLVDKAIGTATVPTGITELAYVQVGAELYNRRSAPNGISQFSAPDGTAIRIARDPMVAAWPLLQPFLPLAVG